MIGEEYEFKEIKEEKVERKQPEPIVVQKPKPMPRKVVASQPAPKFEVQKAEAPPRILKILNPRQVITRDVLEAPLPPVSVEKTQPVQVSDSVLESVPIQIPARNILVKPAPVQETSHEALFGKEREGFSEIDEITSMIEIAKMHGDADDTIKKSLVSSGYNKEKVELAFKKIL